MAATRTALRSQARIAASDIKSDLDLSREELLGLLDLTKSVKANPSSYARSLAGRYLTLLFEKPSLRTRLTFELAIKQLGGDAVVSTGPIGDREPIKDVARNLDRWTNGIVARVFSHHTIEELARWSNVPVINALSDLYHPCQAFADVFTLQEHFRSVRGLKLAYVGDGNNVAHSVMLNAVRLGMHVSIGCPKGYEPNAGIVAQARALAAVCDASVEITHDPQHAVAGAHAVYTDVWTSMGQENEKEQRRAVFAPYQVNAELFVKADSDAVFLHCLPAKRGEEVTDEVIDSPQSVVFDQAENRLHVQKALLLGLL
jgi:ornithine carbamoyltransferase